MKHSECPFCSPVDGEMIIKDHLCYAKWDKFPVSKGHILIIPFRHISSYFDTTHDEKKSITKLIEACKKILDQQFSPDGYNIGVNVGEPAGQTVMHCHIHMIPRYIGDIENPRGGVRGVIPHKREY
jgi:diadenosine tetraphosphate (Ap4A) HIT family hydrolase